MAGVFVGRWCLSVYLEGSQVSDMEGGENPGSVIWYLPLSQTHRDPARCCDHPRPPCVPTSQLWSPTLFFVSNCHKSSIARCSVCTCDIQRCLVIDMKKLHLRGKHLQELNSSVWIFLSRPLSRMLIASGYTAVAQGLFYWLTATKNAFLHSTSLNWQVKCFILMQQPKNLAIVSVNWKNESLHRALWRGDLYDFEQWYHQMGNEKRYRLRGKVGDDRDTDRGWRMVEHPWKAAFCQTMYAVA